ncbi:hypothetical protein [Nocardioides litoris]|uniref:hypothetical protein n=1 Tax=Nocardioides litoris TaxID=1926648 RepID=UPI0011232FA3|nr:hypothetical protein [Nocardioides litoris]
MRGPTAPTTTSLLHGELPVPPRSRPVLPPTLPPARAPVVLGVLAAALAGLAAGWAPATTGLLLVVLVVGGALLLRLEWAVPVAVAALVLHEHLAVLSPRLVPAVVAVLVGSWLVRRGWRGWGGRPGRLPVSRSPVLVAAAVLVLVVLMTAVLDPRGTALSDAPVRSLGLVAVLVVLVDAMRQDLPARRVADVYVAACVVACPPALAAVALGDAGRAAGPAGEPEDLALVLLAAVPLAVALREGARRAWVHDVAAVLLVVTLALTQSTGAVLGLAVAVVLAAVLRPWPWRVLLGGAVLVAAVATAVLGPAPGTLVAAVVDTVTDGAGSTYRAVAAELGVAGLVAWLALLAAALWSAAAAHRRDRDPLASGVLLGGTALVVASVGTAQALALPWWLVAALAAVALQPGRATRPDR